MFVWFCTFHLSFGSVGEGVIRCVIYPYLFISQVQSLLIFLMTRSLLIQFVRLIILTVVTSIALHLTEKCEPTEIYTINKNVYIKPHK